MPTASVRSTAPVNPGDFLNRRKCELQVSKDRLKPGPLPDLAALFLKKGQVPKGAKGRLPSFGTRKILKTHQLLSFLFDVLTQFLGQLLTQLPAAEDSL